MKKLFSLFVVLFFFAVTLVSFAQSPVLRETFNGATFPPTGWVVTNAGSGNNWTRATSSTYEGAGTMQYYYNSSFAANTWAFTPSISMTAGNDYYVVFYQTTGGYSENLKVTVGSGQTIAAQTTTVGTYAGLVNTTYQRLQTSSFTAPSSGNFNFAFNCYSTADQYYLNVDSVNVYEIVHTNMSYSASTIFTANTNPVPLNSFNQVVIGIQIATSGDLNAFNLTALDLNTNGSTDPTRDIDKAKVYYTGTSSTYSPVNQFGSDFNSPNGSFQITGSRTLAQGTNYFWLVYDITGSATVGNFVDAECTQITMDGAGGTQIPTVTAPAGNRMIASSLSGIVNVGSSETYTTLTGSGGLFEAVNLYGLSGDLTANITSNLTEPGTFALNQWSESGIGNYNLRIQPSSASEKIVSGNVGTVGMIRLDGADRVTIDGRFSGSGKYLRFRNTSTSTSGITFLNDATNNTITYCTVESGTTSPAQVGGILFSTTTGTLGNSNNTISFCDLRERTDVVTYPICLVVSNGTSSYPNSNNTIDNCKLMNCYGSGNPANSIYLYTGSNAWTISNNSIYQTSTRTSTGSSTRQFPIVVNDPSGTNFLISGNYIGGTDVLCGGTPMTLHTTTTSTQNIFYGIQLAVGTAVASVVSNNTIRNITLTTIPANGTSVFPFIGILLSSGSANITNNTIGATTGTNSIIINHNGTVLTSTYGLFADGMQLSPTGTCSISNNNVGSITIAGTTTATVVHRIRGILLVGTPSADVNVSNNLFGSNSTAGSLQTSIPSTLRNQQILGIITALSNSQTINITGNTFRNWLNTSTSTTGSGSVITAITHAYSSGTPNVNITNNLIQDLSCSAQNGTTTPGSNAVTGIHINAPTTNQIITGNTIRGLRSTTTNSITSAVYGIAINSTGSTGTVSKNSIYDLTNTSTNAGARIYGTNDYLGLLWTWANNQITLTNGETSLRNSNDRDIGVQNRETQQGNVTNTLSKKDNLDLEQILMQYASVKMQSNNETKIILDSKNNELQLYPVQTEIVLPSKLKDKLISDRELKPESEPGIEPSLMTTSSADIQGFHEEFNSGNTGSYYYNSVYIGGLASGTTNSYCFGRLTTATTTVNIRNNIFYNNRTGGTGFHLAIYSQSTSFTGWSTTACNYNVYITPSSTIVGRWGTTNYDINGWRTASNGSDKQSLSSTTADITPAEMFTNVSAGSLQTRNDFPENWIANGKGIALTGLSTDFNGNPRATTVSAGTTDIGAFEISVDVGPNPPPNALQTNSPGPGIGSGTVSTYTVWNKTIAVIDWGTGGTEYPSAMNVTYYSQVNPPYTVGGNYANSYSVISPVSGVLTGTTYDITYYFGDNETYTISSPSSNTRLAKYDASWVVYPAGTGVNETELNWTNLTAKVRGLYFFSHFTLTDGSAPLPVVLSNFDAAVMKRDISLSWSTESEVNNKGFSVERRSKLDAQRYSAWSEVTFVEGKGTTNNRQSYNFTDKKLNTGAYQYRLKQVDFNGNYEYHTTTANADLVIGKPGSFDIGQNYPNPSNPNSKIDFQMPFDGKVSIKVYDILGKEVATLVDEYRTADFYTVQFDGSNVSSGTYFYRIIAESGTQRFTKTLKMILVK